MLLFFHFTLFNCVIYGRTEVVVKRKNEGLREVPQDVDTLVEELYLEHNLIPVLDNTSLILYAELKVLIIKNNPLKYILEGTFDHNPKIGRVEVYGGQSLVYLLLVLGEHFSKVGSLTLNDAVVNPTIIKYPYFGGFPKLSQLKLLNIPLSGFEALQLQSGMKWIHAKNINMTKFPDLTRFTKLDNLQIDDNPIGSVPTDLYNNVSNKLQKLYLPNCELFFIPNLSLNKPKLQEIVVAHNNLKTIPDVSSLNLKKLRMANNPLICDQRMCWRRLWDRFKPSFRNEDHPMCFAPPELEGMYLAKIDPTILGCFHGKLIHGLFK